MPHKLGFALEYSLGHTTHAQNLKQSLATDQSVVPFYVDLPYHKTPGWWSQLPGVRSNWSARASLGAYYGLRRQADMLDAALFHTQVTSLFSAGLMRRLPSVISLDATPIQYDALGAAYGHAPSSSARLEHLKKRLNLRAFHSAKRLVTWSQWAKDSLVADYGVPADKIAVIPPGIDLSRWDFQKRSASPSGPVRLLFVGGDFTRKGGDTLLEAFRLLPAGMAHLDIVTQASGVGKDLDDSAMTVHHGLGPNSEGLLRLYASADLFVFPTRADCLPLAVMEALASGLPVITTAVAALPEAVTHGQTGWIVPPNDSAALAEAIRTLASDPALRVRLAQQARQSALESFDATTNYRRLVETVRSIAR
jgi:glycosyltransferase involved in cell wall biosynthesis